MSQGAKGGPTKQTYIAGNCRATHCDCGPWAGEFNQKERKHKMSQQYLRV